MAIDGGSRRINLTAVEILLLLQVFLAAVPDEKMYGRSVKTTEMVIRNSNALTNPSAKLMYINAEPNKHVSTILLAGVLFLLSLLKNPGINSSLLIDDNTCPPMRIHPFNAPNVEIATPNVTRYPVFSPQMFLAASEKGASLAARSLAESSPNRATVAEI